MIPVSSCSCLCRINWSQTLSREWRCSWSSVGAAPTISEWSTSVLPSKVRLILEVWCYIRLWQTCRPFGAMPSSQLPVSSSGYRSLTHKKMAARFSDDNFKCNSVDDNSSILVYFLAAAKHFCPSVCPSVRPSVRLLHLYHNVPLIVSSWNFQDFLPMTEVMSMQKVKVRGQRSRSQRSKLNLAVIGL